MISAIIHTYNEEKNIERCLVSLTFADEVIVVDMGSADRTCQIATSYHAKIFQHPYTGFVEPARNFGLSKAVGEWIIVVDADEEIPQSLAKYLLIEAQNSNFDFFRIARKNIIFSRWVRHSGWWPDYQIRFFKKGNVSWSDKIHGIPLTKGLGKDIEATEALSITHYNYQTVEQYIERLNRYSTISAKQLYLDNEHFKIATLFEKITNEFITRFFVWQGFKDGVHGLALSLLQSLAETVTYLKLWELEQFKEEKISLTEIEKLMVQDFKTKQHWFINEKLTHPHNIIEEAIWRIKNKLHIYG